MSPTRFLRRLPGIAAALALVVAPVAGAEFKIGERTLVVPEGFEVELAAGPPLVDRPIAVSRDEWGRLYVTDSAGMSDKADKQLELKPHRILRLEDVDGDGKYEKSTVFADRMMFPEGCLWHEGSLYVAAPPQIWKLTDTDGDGTADKREVWHDGKTLTGCANDLHGPYLGPDGWLYFCKGAFAEQTHEIRNGGKFVTRASHIFRQRPDGSGLEPVLTGGMDNPVNVAFHSTGERFLSCTFFQFPEAGRRDGLIHAIYGGVYGKKHDSIYAHKMTGDVMPVLVHEGAAAPCGLTCAPESLFGGGYFDNLFACYFNLHKVVRHELIPKGATFSTKDTDFVSCEHPDFHPTDVFPDADGSLLVVDTGGWYKVCCPTSQLAKPDVLGAIYRIRRKGAPVVADPLGLTLNWQSRLTPEAIEALLSDARPFVQRRAIERLRSHGPDVVRPLVAIATNHAAPAVRRRALWVLGSVVGLEASHAVGAGLNDPDRTVQLVALQLSALNQSTANQEKLLELVMSDDAAVARGAAEAIGRTSYKKGIEVLLRAAGRLGKFEPDGSGAPKDERRRVFEHSLIYALIEIGDHQRTAYGFASPYPQVHRVAMVAQDQMDASKLQPERVIPQLDSSEPIVRNTAAWIVGHRPDWGMKLVDYFRDRLGKPEMADPEQTELVALLAQLARSPAIQELTSTTLKNAPTPLASTVALRAMSEAKLPITPTAWLDDVASFLRAAPPESLPVAVAAARALPLPKGGHPAMKAALLAVGTKEDVSVEVRFAALTGAGGIGEVDTRLLQELASRARPEESYELRTAATGILAAATLSPEQRIELLKTLHVLGPFELPRLLAAYERGPTEEQGLALAAALSAASGFKSLRPDQLQPLFAKYPQAVQEAGAKLIAILNAAAAEQAAFLQQVQSELPAGNVRRGHEVFVGKKAACIACHAVGYLGGRLGPDLTNIAKSRNDRDLIESIIFPSASFVRSYEPVIVELEDGRIATGIVVKETADELVLATGPQQSQPLARRDVAEIHPSKVSLMPQGFATQLTRQELADLLAYLKAPR